MGILLVRCRGHPNVQASHETTLELEESSTLTIRGDCIVCVECENTSLLREYASEKGLAKLFLIVVNPFIDPYIAYAVIDGLLPGKAPRRLVVRKSSYSGDSLMICSSLSASELPYNVRKLLRSSYTRCYALFVSFTPSTEIDTIYKLTGCIIEDTYSPNNAPKTT